MARLKKSGRGRGFLASVIEAKCQQRGIYDDQNNVRFFLIQYINLKSMCRLPWQLP